LYFFKHLPNFGEFKKQQDKLKAQYYKKTSVELCDEESTSERNLIVLNKDKVRKLKDIIGRSLDKIGSYNQLNNEEQVVALIDEVIFC
jgi:dihydropyrimidine dehydrogenase (NADP+)